MKRFVTLIALLAINFTLFSQAPQRLSYQTVIRNSSGGLVVSHAVGMKISILQGTSTGTPVYVETHTTTTNPNGLATIEIGGGNIVSGTFSTINWGSGTYYLKTETDPAGGTSYTIAGTSQLLSVPYALYAKQVETGSSQWSGSGSDIYFNAGKVGIGKIPGTDLRQFQVLTESYQAIAAVNNSNDYAALFVQNNGTGPAADFRNKIRIADGTHGTGKVLTSDVSGLGSWQNLPPDGLTLPFAGTISIGTNALSITNEGGTGIYSKGLEAGISGEATSLYGYGVMGTGSTSGIFGQSSSADGYGISGRGINKGIKGEATATTGVTIGVEGRASSISGIGVFGFSTYTGVLGQSGATSGEVSGVEGSAQSNIGYGVKGIVISPTGKNFGIYGRSTSSEGTGTYGEATSTSGSTFGIKGIVKSGSGFSGHFSGGKFYIQGNTGIGTETPGELLHINNDAGRSSMRLSAAAASLSEVQFYSAGTYKGAIGYQNASDYLFIYQNGNIIFKNGRIGIQTVTNPTYAIELPNSSATGTGVARAFEWSTYSDGRFKSDMQVLPYGLEEVMQLKPVRYFHHNSVEINGDLVMEEEGKQGIGFIAQDIYKIIPEVVNKPHNERSDFWSMSYEKLTPVLVKAIQELKAENDELKTRLSNLEAKIGK